MSKRLTYLYVKEQIEKIDGFKLISNEYINNKTELDILCSVNHKFKMRFDIWTQRYRCPICNQTVKYTYEFVKEQIEKGGYKLLSKEYVNNKSGLEIQCPEGHEYKIRFDNWTQGFCRCQYCKGIKYHHTYVKEQIEKEGYRLLSQYKNNKTKLKIECPAGHVYHAAFYVWKRGNRCLECTKIPFDYLYDEISKEGYKLLELMNNSSKLKIQCSENHIYEAPWRAFKIGQRCPYCSGVARLTYEFVKEQIEKEGYKLLSKEYKNSHSKLYVLCPYNHKYNMTWSAFKCGRRCPRCYAKCQTSKIEKEVVDIIKKFTNENIVENDRTQIMNPETKWNLELDIWIPSLRKAIEFNGNYWHSKKSVARKDNIKIKECKRLDIDLLVIMESEWINDKIICVDNIRNFIQKKDKAEGKNVRIPEEDGESRTK